MSGASKTRSPIGLGQALHNAARALGVHFVSGRRHSRLSERLSGAGLFSGHARARASEPMGYVDDELFKRKDAHLKAV